MAELAEGSPVDTVIFACFSPDVLAPNARRSFRRGQRPHARAHHHETFGLSAVTITALTP